MLDDVLDDIISTKTSPNKLTTCMSKRLINMIDVNGYEHNFQKPNKPPFVIQGASSPQTSQPLNKSLFVVQGGYSNNTFCSPNKPFIIVQGGYPTNIPYEYAKKITQESYNSISHTNNIRNNRQPNPPLAILSSQLILPPTLCLSQHFGKAYELIEQLKASPTKMSILDLIQISSIHHGMIQYDLKNLDVPLAVTPNNMASLIDSMKASKAQIVFSHDELSSKEIQNQYDLLMIVFLINSNAIR